MFNYAPISGEQATLSIRTIGIFKNRKDAKFMKDLLKQKEELEQQLLLVNQKIESEQKYEQINNEINLKTKELGRRLTDDLLIKVHYLAQDNKVLITEYFEEDYEAFPYYDNEYESIWYLKHVKNSYAALEELKKIEENVKVLKNKLKLLKLLRKEYKHTYSTDTLNLTNNMEISHIDSVSATLPENFTTHLFAKAHFNTNNTVNLNITSTISYPYDLDIKSTKIIDNIEFDVTFEGYQNYGAKIETFKCTLDYIEIDNVCELLQKIKTITFSNASLIKISSSDWEANAEF